MKTVTLDNGLQTLFEHRKGTGVVSIQVWVKVGSKYEDERVAGITHFIEHLIFKGTGEGGGYEIAPKIEALGGSINAFTSYDNTVYHIVVPETAFETGLELLIGAVKNPLFPEKEIAKEKGVVIEEIKMGEDNPQRKLFKELFSQSYEGHPYGRPIIGFEQTVKATERPDIVAYFNEHYTIDNMLVVIVGDFDEAKAKKLLEKHSTGIRRQGLSRSASVPAPGSAGRTVLIEREVREGYLALSWPVPPLVHKDIPALDVLGKIMGDGDSSRFQAELKHKKGIVTNAGTYLFAPKEDGLFVILATFKGADHDAVVKGIDGELKRLADGSIDPWEMEKAKNLVRAGHIYGMETVQGRAREIGYYQTITGDPRFSDAYMKEIDKVSAADVKRVLQVYVYGRARNLAVLSQKPKPNPRVIRLKNGLTCVLNRNDASPSVSFMVGFVGGLKEEKEGRNGSFNVLSKMLLRGTKTKDAQAIARQEDTLAGSIDPVSGKNVVGLSGKFLAKDFKESMTLLKELLTETAMREDELRKVREDVLSEIRQKNDEPVSFTFKTMNRVLFEGHPYARDVLGSSQEVEQLSLDDVTALYREYVSPDGAVLAVSGQIDLEETETMLRSLFSPWTGKAHPLKKLVPAAKKKEQQVERKIFQTHLVFSFLGPGLASDERYASEVMDAVLSGMGGRIHRRLREERPYAYALTFFNQMAYETAALGIYIGTDLKYVDEIRKVVNAEIEQIHKDGFTDDEIANAKRYLVGNHRTHMQTNSAIASSMCLDTIYGLKADFFKRWPALIEKVTKAEVDAVARKYLALDKMVVIQLGPPSSK